MKLIRIYLKHLKKTNLLFFSLELFFGDFIISLLIATINVLLFKYHSNVAGVVASGVKDLDLIGAFNLVITTPIVETLLLQLLPIQIVSIFTANLFDQWLLSTLFFSALHAPSAGVISFLGALSGGGFFSLAFLLKREQSIWTGIWVTSFLHALHNLLALLRYKL